MPKPKEYVSSRQKNVAKARKVFVEARGKEERRMVMNLFLQHQQVLRFISRE